nr:cyclin-D1-1-like isoform X2 [Tanacetum cinerariifolium]
DASARGESVAWILKVQRFYGFQPLTAYLSVNYLDRFIYCRGFPVSNGWPLQLLAVACLSLAAKMEEPLVPSIIDLQEKITKCYRLVQGMSPLNRSITKFSKIVPVQVRVMTRTSTESGDSSSSSSSPSSYKRRKLNNSSW